MRIGKYFPKSSGGGPHYLSGFFKGLRWSSPKITEVLSELLRETWLKRWRHTMFKDRLSIEFPVKLPQTSHIAYIQVNFAFSTKTKQNCCTLKELLWEHNLKNRIYSRMYGITIIENVRQTGAFPSHCIPYNFGSSGYC